MALATKKEQNVKGPIKVKVNANVLLININGDFFKFKQ